jgi:hypothetical protein
MVLQGWARWTVNTEYGYVASMHCEKQTTKASSICDQGLAYGHVVPLQDSVRAESVVIYASEKRC